MICIELGFPARRFHATPWGRHVNEGVAEWPPSPYRLLRALYDVWKRKHPELSESAVQAAFQALAAELPTFLLPQVTASHTRGYLSSNTEDPNDKSLIFDGFVSIAPGRPGYIRWALTTLGEEQQTVLRTLLGSLNYLGRSESWITAQLLLDEPSPAAPLVEFLPVAAGGASGDVVPLACPVAPAQYQGKQPWLEALAYSTADLLKQKRSAPPALRMVQYVRPRNAVLTRVAPRFQRQPPGISAMMVTLDGKLKPVVTATVEIAEQLRVRLMGIHKRLMGDESLVSSMFSGKDTAGQPRAGHDHLFMLPLGNPLGRIDRVLLYTRSSEGFTQPEIDSILQLPALFQKNVAPADTVRCVVTWKGTAEDDLVRPSALEFTSTTPFVTIRHWRKGRGSALDFLIAEVRRECRNHGLPEPIGVELADRPPHALFEWIEFRRNRKDEPSRPGYGFHLSFAEPVAAPFSLGYGCHFGLGQFDAAH